MKKVLFVIVAAAILLSLCMINSFAAGSVTGVSRDQVVIDEDNKDVASIGGNPDPTSVDLTAYTGKTLRIWGWIGTTSAINGFGYTINGGELITGDFAVAAGQDVINAAAGGGATEASRFKILVPITEGGYTIDAYVLMESGNEKIWTVEVNGGDPNAVTYKWADAAAENNIGLWMRNLNDKAVAKFTTKYDFDAVRLPIYWASTIGNQGATPNFTLSVYANADNVDLALDAAPLVSRTFEATGDNNPAAVFEFDSPLPAGTYYFVVETVGTNGKDFDGTSSSAYLVVPTASSGSADYFNILATGKHANDAINFSIRAAQSAPFDTNPEEVPHPELFNLDFALLFDGAAFVENLGKGANLGQLKKPVAAGGNQLYLLGWYVPPTNIAAYGYQIDGGPIVYAIEATYDENTAAVLAGWGYDAAKYRGFAGLVPIQEGAHTIKLIATFTSGRSKVIYQTSYKCDDTDIALDKPVYIDLNGIRNGSGYWADEYINDGYNPVHNPAVVPDPVPLGFYPVSADLKANIYIDLQGIYDLTEIDLHAQGFNNFTFPSAYDLYTSADGINWDLVARVTGREGNVDSADPFVYETTNRARYIRMDIITGVVVDGYYYAGIGEIEAYGTFVEESAGKAPYLPYSTYRGNANVGDTGGKSDWNGFQSGTLVRTYVFNTDVSFYKVGFPAFWGSANTPVRFEFIKDGTVVLTKEITIAGDGGFKLDLGETLPAGEYVMRLTILNNDLREDGSYQCYTVIGYANEGLLGNEYVACEAGQIALDLYSDDQGEGFVKRGYKQRVNIDVIRLDGVDQGTDDNIAVIVDENSREILVHGWLAANYPIEKYGYKVDGGETVYDDSFINKDFGTAEAPNADALAIWGVAKDLYAAAGTGYRANVTVPVTEGTHTVQIVALVAGEEKVMRTLTYAPKGAFLEVMARDQITVDGVDKAEVGGNIEVTDISENLYPEFGRQLRIWGWYGNNRALDKYGVKVDGGEIVYFDRYEAEDIVNHIKTNLIKNQDVFASRFEIFVDITEGRHTAEVFAIVDGEEHLIWTVNYACMPEEAPQTTGDQPQTGDASVAIFAVFAVLAMGAAAVFARKRAHGT